MYSIFGFLAPPLGYVVQFIYSLVQNYGWTLILFTILIRVVLFPLAIRQQKSTARMGAYQPMLQEIQKKWANDRNRQNQEVQKFYQENNIKMTAGCLPMVINLIVLFGVIAVIQAPLQYIVHVPEDQIAAGIQIVEHYYPEKEMSKNTYTQQSILIGEMQENPQYFLDGVEVEGEDGKTTLTQVAPEWVDAITEFNFEFLGLDLSQAPSMNFNRNLILPILSVLTMLGSQVIIMKFSGQGAQQGKAMMWIMTLVMGVVFAVFAFRIPIGFSLYYTASNCVMTVQQLIVKKIYDPKKIREQLEQEIEARRKAKKEQQKAKTVIVTADDGEVQELTETDAVKARLERARRLDALKYGEDKGGGAGTSASPKQIKKKEEPAPAADAPEEASVDTGEEAEETKPEAPPAEKKPDYKPGRRRRASQKKTPADDEDESFADKEMRAEKEAELRVTNEKEEAGNA